MTRAISKSAMIKQTRANNKDLENATSVGSAWFEKAAINSTPSAGANTIITIE
ncbi:MAG: hypothetical protein GY927_20805 [bacterium]|nr:hypothetical protein [bacterium]